MRIALELPKEASFALRSRLTYAFRLFCAIYGHNPLAAEHDALDADILLSYRDRSVIPHAERRIVQLSQSYRARSPYLPAPPPLKYEESGVATLVHHLPAEGHSADWLGEIFEWVSCADEYSVIERDSVGRPLFAATYAGRFGINTQVPYAAIAMQCLQLQICRAMPCAETTPRGPQGTNTHFIVPTHDVDYFPIGRLHAANRLVRNAVISSIIANKHLLAMRQAAHAFAMAAGIGLDPLDKISALAEEEHRREIKATFNFLVQHAHRLDATYTLQHKDVMSTMRWLESRGMEIGLHGSYTCLDHSSGMKSEKEHLHTRGFNVRGGRQHWLRYTLDRLIPAVEAAGLDYDMSIGWSERIGFRAFACFAFPPYNFNEERPAKFLEIPLAVMDQALCIRERGVEQMFPDAADVLATSRRWGWGGISLLWHPTAFGHGWLPPEVGGIFWQLADARTRWGDSWIKAADFMGITRQRYVDVGLLPAINAESSRQLQIQEVVEMMHEEALNGLCSNGLTKPNSLVDA
jgi:hypothetical protein